MEPENKKKLDMSANKWANNYDAMDSSGRKIIIEALKSMKAIERRLRRQLDNFPNDIAERKAIK